MKPQVYVDPRPADFFTKYHERTRTRRPDWVYRAARIVLTPPILTLYRYRAIDVSNVPESGPVLLAPNHFSFWDHFFVAVLLRRHSTSSSPTAAPSRYGADSVTTRRSSPPTRSWAVAAWC